MVKISNVYGDIKTGKQSGVCYQRHYGQQVRRTISPKTTPSTNPQLFHRQRFQAGLAWRKTLSKHARAYLDGYTIHHSLFDDNGVPLDWSRFALKIALEAPKVAIQDYN